MFSLGIHISSKNKTEDVMDNLWKVPLNERQRIHSGRLKMDKTNATQDEEKQNKNTIQYVLNTTKRKQTQLT